MALPFVRSVLIVNVDVDILHALLYPGSEPLIKSLQAHLKHSPEHVTFRAYLSILMNQLQQFFEAVVFSDVLDHQIGLEISKAEIGITVGARETGVEIA